MASVSKRCSVMAQSPSIVRVFLLSPANASGERMQMLLRLEAGFELAQRLRAGSASLGEAFAFTSGLYFRGKLAYAQEFARAPEGVPGVLVIAPAPDASRIPVEEASKAACDVRSRSRESGRTLVGDLEDPLERHPGAAHGPFVEQSADERYAMRDARRLG